MMWYSPPDISILGFLATEPLEHAVQLKCQDFTPDPAACLTSKQIPKPPCPEISPPRSETEAIPAVPLLRL